MATHLEPVRLDRSSMRTPRDKGDVVPSLRQDRAHIAPQPSGPNDDNPHASVTQPRDAEDTDRM